VLVFKAHRLWFLSTLGSRVIKKKRTGVHIGIKNQLQPSPFSGGLEFGVVKRQSSRFSKRVKEREL